MSLLHESTKLAEKEGISLREARKIVSLKGQYVNIDEIFVGFRMWAYSVYIQGEKVGCEMSYLQYTENSWGDMHWLSKELPIDAMNPI